MYNFLKKKKIAHMQDQLAQFDVRDNYNSSLNSAQKNEQSFFYYQLDKWVH